MTDSAAGSRLFIEVGYMMMHRQPGLRPSPSRAAYEDALPPFVSSSSMKSCGLIVMCKTFGASVLNFESNDSSQHHRFSFRTRKMVANLSAEPYHPTTSQS